MTSEAGGQRSRLNQRSSVEVEGPLSRASASKLLAPTNAFTRRCSPSTILQQ